MKHEDWKRELLESVCAHKDVMLLSVLAVMAGAFCVAWYWPATHAATASVLVRGVQVHVNPGALDRPEIRGLAVPREAIATEMEILLSPELVRQVAQPKEGEDGAELLARMERIRDHLEVEVVPATNVINLRLSDPDAVWAEKTLDDLLHRYIAFRAEVFHPSGQEGFLNERVKKYHDGLTEAEDRLVNLSAESSVTRAEVEIDNNLGLIRDLKAQRNDLVQQRAQLEHELKPLQEALAQDRVQYFTFLDLATVDHIGTHLKELKAEHARLSRIYRPGVGPLESLEAGIQEAYGELRFEIQKIMESRQVKLAALTQREQNAAQSIAALEARNVELQRHGTEVQRVNRELGLLAYSYETFSKRAEEERINTAIASANFSGEVSILNGAAGTAELVFPQKPLVLGLGLFVGLLTGLSMTLLLEFFDHTIRRSSDVSRFVQLPLICSIRKV